MNFKYILCIFILLGLFIITNTIEAAVTPDDPTNFITTWNTENSGTSANNEITIPGTGGGYSYEIYWEDTASSTINGTTTLITTDSYTLAFPAPGIYEVQASGTIPRIYFNNSGDKDKILTVEQWGNNEWVSMGRAFFRAVNLTIPASDAPDLSNVTDMSYMLRFTTAFNQNINSWDTSNVTDMSHMLRGASTFNQPLNNWDVSSVTDMSNLFDGAYAFNQPLNNWDTSSTTNMDRMFNSASAFNQPLSNWNTSNVVSMMNMFNSASAFNQPLSNWNTSNVVSMRSMFNSASAFNQPLNNWDVSSVTDMSNLFIEAPTFNQPLNNWDTSSTTDMSYMFYQASVFNQPLDNWDVSSVTNMTEMFLSVELSTANQDSILDSWSEQIIQNDVPFHIGVKSYSNIGETAISNLTNTYNWTISEQYKATYGAGSNASLIGNGTQIVNNGETTTEVTLVPDAGYEFIKWSDEVTDNPRTDTLNDNLTVSAVLESLTASSGGGGSSSRSRRSVVDESDEPKVADKVPTIETILVDVKKITQKPLIPTGTNPDRSKIIELIILLTELLDLLIELLSHQITAEAQ